MQELKSEEIYYQIFKNYYNKKAKNVNLIFNLLNLLLSLCIDKTLF